MNGPFPSLEDAGTFRIGLASGWLMMIQKNKIPRCQIVKLTRIQKNPEKFVNSKRSRIFLQKNTKTFLRRDIIIFPTTA